MCRMKNPRILVGMVSAAFFGTASAVAGVLEVGPGKAYATPSAAFSAARDGDTIVIAEGVYHDVCYCPKTPNLTVRGAGIDKTVIDGSTFNAPSSAQGGPHLAGWKGLWVVTAEGWTIEGVTFRNARIPGDAGANGAGLRYEADGDVTIRGCSFTGCQNGILCGALPHATMTIEASEFHNNGNHAEWGGEEGYTHNLYIGVIKELVFRNCISDHAYRGHDLKSRALKTVIENCVFDDGHDGRSSYLVNCPQGGDVTIAGCTFVQSEASDNARMISIADGDGLLHPGSVVYAENNTFTNYRHSCVEMFVGSGVPVLKLSDRIEDEPFAGGVPAAPIADGEILVGTTGYGTSPEYRELRENDECNLWVQWSVSENLLPEKLGRDWYDWAVSNRGHVMTIYGDQDGKRSKALREAWGDLYLGNNLGEYAGFLYQDEKSYGKHWPKLTNLKEAHDWFVGEMMAAPKKLQLSRPADERDPYVFSTSGSPLACYELAAGVDFICNEMYAVGCGNIGYATAEARGAAKRWDRNWWSAWLAHEWQTAWPRLPYLVPQKMDSLEVGLKEMWLMGTSMMVLESGSQTTQAHPYTPLDASMADFKCEKQGYDDPVPRAYRKTMKDFYQWTKAHPRAKGMPCVPMALALGNYDGYVGMTFDIFATFGQHHLAATNANWRCGKSEETWNALQDLFWPRPKDALKPYANGWLGGTPYGQVDVVALDESLSPAKLKDYRLVILGGWNSMTPKLARAVCHEYCAAGGTLYATLAQFSSRLDREGENFTAEDLVGLPTGLAVKGASVVEDILMVGPSAPAALRAAYPAHLSQKFRLAEVELDGTWETLATMGKRPLLVRKRVAGKGLVYVNLAWGYPGSRNDKADFHLAVCDALAREVAGTTRVQGPDARYVNWSVYPDGTAYFINTDCVSRRIVSVDGEPVMFEPKEMKRRAARGLWATMR